MATNRQIVVRTPETLVARLDGLLPYLEGDPELSSVGRVTRSSVARLAMQLGVAELERRQRGEVQHG